MDSLEQMLEDYRNGERGLPTYEELVVFADITSKLPLAAIKWWEHCRPLDWDENQHLNTPSVNTLTNVDGELAIAIAAHITNFHKEPTC